MVRVCLNETLLIEASHILQSKQMIRQYNQTFQLDETKLSEKHSKPLIKYVKLDFLCREFIPIST